MSIKLPLNWTRSFTRPLPAVTTITSPSKTLLSRTVIPTSVLVPMPAVPQTQSYPTSVPSFPRSTHTHSPLPPPREILVMSPKPCAVCYLQEAQCKSTGPPSPPIHKIQKSSPIHRPTHRRSNRHLQMSPPPHRGT